MNTFTGLIWPFVKQCSRLTQCTRKAQILMWKKKKDVYNHERTVILRPTQLVQRCVRPSYNGLCPHHFNTFNRWWCRFHISLQNESSPTNFCSVSVQPPTIFRSTRTTATYLSLLLYSLCLSLFLGLFHPFFLSLFSCCFCFKTFRHTKKRKVDSSIPLLAVKLNQKENYFDRWGIKGDMIQTEPTF